ncbi:MAG: hypothetical protein IJ299_01855 [Oscillospiraceae bacterium]|nr:hypothetical protein [Oscillospiraceae bacterium]
MHRNTDGREYSLLFFPKRSSGTYAMYVSSPPPLWLDDTDMSKIVINSPGMYCLFFLVTSGNGGKAYITVNGREIRGSYAEEKSGAISGSAVCSIRDRAIPCSLGIKTEGRAREGVLLVAKCDV